ncbi:uncharacterized protein LOC129298729 [Prosopis cineraria]|uniref:uncharacterized protein LOC129298729 n=1 Tax=Prosopis cineraria TaxID=364024 RepID=UPI00240ED4C9|nr:uncharacterized protein LOC129298729 [Prosopis cineraria]
MCRVENPRNNNMKLEDLPEHLIHHIMHFLPYKEAAKFSVLSIAFYSSWLSFPTLKFTYKATLSKGVSYHTFFHSVQKTLKLRGPHIKGSLHKLSLSYMEIVRPNSQHHRKVFDVLLNFALQNNVKEINFDISNDIGNLSYYDSLLPLFSSQFLTVLKLSGIKNILFCDASITCPELKELVIHHCDAFQTINVSSSSLKKVEVICCKGLKAVQLLEGKSIHSFKFEGFKTHACDINIPSCDSLRYLHLTNVEISENICNKVVPQVEFLHLVCCNMPKNLRLHNPHVKVLKLKRNRKLENIVLSTPNLERFSYEEASETRHCRLDISECLALRVLKLVRATTITDGWLKRTIWVLLCLKKLDIRECNRLTGIEFENDSLEKFSLYECSQLKEVNVDVSNLLEFCYSGSLQVYPMFILSAKCNGNIKLPSGRSDLDSVKQFLGCFDHFKDLTISCSRAEFKYGNEVESKNMKVEECCYDVPIKCWRHYEVKIEIQGLDESVRQCLENFFATSLCYYGIYRHG